jgi:competence protein ComEC
MNWTAAAPAPPSAHRLPMRRPLPALASAFAAGILLAEPLGPGGWPAWVLLGLSAGGAAVCAVLRIGGAVRFLLWLLALVAAGWLRGAVVPPPVEAAPAGRVVLVGRADSGWQRLGDSRRLLLEAEAVREPGGPLQPFGGRVRLLVLALDGADACPGVLPGDRVRVLVRLRRPPARHNPGGGDPRRRLLRRGVAYTATVPHCREVLVEPAAGGGLRRAAERARAAVAAFIDSRAAPADRRALLAALTIGEAGGIEPELRRAFSRAGLAHLLAVSGLHLAFVALGFYWLLVHGLARIQRLGNRLDVRRLAAGLVVPAVGFYVLLAGARLPSVRAGVAVGCFLVAAMVQRRIDPLQSLAAAALLVLGLWPQSLFDISFQLSFAAVAGLLLLAPPLADALRLPWRRDEMPGGRWARLRVRALQLVLISAVAGAATAPLVAAHFHQVSLLGMVANLIAVPLAAWLLVPLGLIAAVLLVPWPAAAGALLDLALWVSGGLIALAEQLARLPVGHWTTAGPDRLQLLAWYAGLLALAGWRRGRAARWLAAAAAGVLLVSWAAGALAPRLRDRLELVALDVGQGESLLLRLPGGGEVLIDGGGAYRSDFDVGRHVVAPALWALGVDELEAVVVSHRHPDHVGGLPAVVELFSPRQLWTPGPLADSETSAPLAAAVAAAGVEVRRPTAGDRVYDRDGVRIDVLWPGPGAAALEENERSLVLRVRHGGVTMLLTGDLERRGEAALLGSGVDLRADLLKVGHHGSRHGTSQAFLERVRPRVALISVGADNRYHLPHPSLLQRLERAGARIWRTDRHGAIRAISDGGQLAIVPAVEPEPAAAPQTAQKLPARPTLMPAAPGCWAGGAMGAKTGAMRRPASWSLDRTAICRAAWPRAMKASMENNVRLVAPSRPVTVIRPAMVASSRSTSSPAAEAAPISSSVTALATPRP